MVAYPSPGDVEHDDCQHHRLDPNQDNSINSMKCTYWHSYLFLIFMFRLICSFNSIAAFRRYPLLWNHVAPSAFMKLSHSAMKIACDFFRHTRTSYPFITRTSISTANQDGILKGCHDGGLRVRPHCPILHYYCLSNTTPTPQAREISSRRLFNVIRDPPLRH